MDIAKDIRPWLYASADRMILSYKRKHTKFLELESISEDKLTVDFPYNDVLLSLNEEEKKLLIAYFSGADKAALAKEYGISQNALYKRVSRLKERLINALDEIV